MRRIITLCTDFGLRDGYVAAMKGVILSIAPEARLVDISHDVTRQSIREGAFLLNTACRCFPSGTVHLVVIDPGVGGSRRAMAIETGRFLFVGPDNGVLTSALRGEALIGAVALTNRTYWRHGEVSHTFHGRDVFAPVAAHLANGVPLAALGAPIDDPLLLCPTKPELRADGGIVGHVVHVDRFGNVITDIPETMLSGSQDWQITVGKAKTVGLRETYESVGPGELLALTGSHGCLEIAVREGDAAHVSGASVGDIVTLK